MMELTVEAKLDNLEQVLQFVDSQTAVITFIDHGVPYDPLAKDDPDVTLSITEREIGGLGIFMVKKSMDDMVYEYQNGQNILTIRKRIG